MRALLTGVVLLFSLTAWSAIPKATLAIPTAKKTILIAIIDTGVDAKHSKLKDYIWNNPGESGADSKGQHKENNGIDDDDNGFVDDFQGWNFVSNSPDITDLHGHGTHIAGIIQNEVQSNKIDFSKRNTEVKFMILKYFNSKASSSENIKNSNAALKYALKMNAQIINYSGGGGQQSFEELQTLKEAETKGILLVAAAGNEGFNADLVQYFPASYPLKNIVSVAALDPHGQLLKFSNYGVKSITFGAPGQNIYSTLPGNKFGFMSGTSQATAQVTGLAATLTHQLKNQFAATDLIKLLLKNAQIEPALKGKTKFAASLGLLPRIPVAKQALNAN